MGKVTRERYGAEFKAKVAMEAIRGELTLAELSAKHSIRQTQRPAPGEADLPLSPVRLGHRTAERGLLLGHHLHPNAAETMDGQRIHRAAVAFDEYECVYPHAFEIGLALYAGLLLWISHYNTRRPHSALAGRTPEEAYFRLGSTPSRGHVPATASRLKLAA